VEVHGLILEEYAGELESAPAGTARIHSDIGGLVPQESAGSTLFQFTARDAGTRVIFIEAPLGDGVGYWHPDSKWERALPADWHGRTSTSLVSSAPIGCLYDHADNAIVAFALDELVRQVAIRFGVSEESASFVVRIELVMEEGQTLSLLVSHGGESLTSTVADLREWLQSGLGVAPMPVPIAAREPVYSTWYSFHDSMTAESLEAEALEARALGCGSVFIDFGWQRGGVGRYFDGCGDWVADAQKFPDFAGTVARLKEHDLAVVAWIAPLFVGENSAAITALRPWAPIVEETLRVRILDPRIPEVRTHAVAECMRVVREYGLDGLKIDFLDTAMAYVGIDGPGDMSDVGEAMSLMLGDLRAALHSDGLDSIIIEFRQPYVSPAIAAFGNVLRAGDCPGDTLTNRTSIIDARMSSSQQVVHSDMMMWHPELEPQAVARHLHSALFSVPQLSVMLRSASEEHRSVIRSWLAQWRQLSATLLDGQISARGAHIHFPVVRADSPDGASAVIAVYEPDQVVVLERPAAHTVVVNATPLGMLRLDLTGSVDAFTAVCRDLHGSVTAERELDGSTGLVALPVVPSGTATLSRTRDRH
jgi:alpha-galactosidase